ncbi:hypothetical protein WJX81_005255 [Elliptochloris bilobata]|uniref:EF-hand domain-containing protein n=1 Tax=Elliptochloris bilobata TaxID=381761 RepID=A0AAW1SAC5_9CHLO
MHQCEVQHQLEPLRRQNTGTWDHRSQEDLASSSSEGQKAAGQRVHSEQESQRVLLTVPAGRTIIQFVAAWEHLAPRLPRHAGAGHGAERILGALKLAVALSGPELAPAALAARAALGDGRSPATRALSIASTLADLASQGLPLDADSIAAGIVAEAVQRGRLPLPTVEARLGPTAAGLTADILKVRGLPARADLYDDAQAAALRELCLSFYDARATVVEIAARADALRHMAAAEAWRRQLAALEALQIYAPIGHALGLGLLSSELEDRCFQELFPQSYAQTAAWLQRERTANTDTLARCRAALQAALGVHPALQALAAGCQVAGRTKSLFSTMKKLLRLDDLAAGGRERAGVHDLLALRVVVDPRPDLPPDQAEAACVQACYEVRAVAERLWPPLVARAKDYIAAPKPNGYQSLHVTLRVPGVTAAGATSLELQIRTRSMHEAAESGEAAHTAYKGGLLAGQAARLSDWTQALQPPPGQHDLPCARADGDAAAGSGGLAPTYPVPDGEAAAVELFRHLDTNGDGLVSEMELRVALGDLGAGGHAPAAAQELVGLAAGDSDSGGGARGVSFADWNQFVRRVLEEQVAARAS